MTRARSIPLVLTLLVGCGGGGARVGSLGGACTQGLGCDPGLTCNASRTCVATAADDLANPSPGDMAVADKIVFVTSITFLVDSIGSIAGGDTLCLSQAEKAGLPGHYQAWLSDSQTNAIDHITGTGPWATPAHVDINTMVSSRQPVFANHAALSGDPLNAIAVDELGEIPENYVWTGTDVGGTALAAGACGDWTSTQPAPATVGSSSVANDGWTNLANAMVTCDDPLALYCFEI